ncbi:hypothetical protein LCGC14_3004470 [marine sediment metagenome]|uniref:Twin-arginine translocation signal domain-containing protein n=1 Tax=marine sediment metagenome TaxID=412755 RepID=A0A0F8Z7Q6_9ZZZZ
MNRRDFLRLAFRTGAVTAAGLHLPYVPKPTAFVISENVPLWEVSDLIVADILSACELADRRVCITD